MVMKRHSRAKMIAAWLFVLSIAVAGFAFSVGILFVGAANFHKQKLAIHWPTTEGVIISAKINNLGRGNVIPVYTYRYTVNNKQYSNNRQFIGSGVIYVHVKDAQLNMKKHPIQSKIKIHYNPDLPEDSTILISLDTGFANIVQSITGLILFVAFAYFPFYLLRPGKKMILFH